MNITILGTAYECVEVPRDGDPRLSDCDGYCDAYIKKIVIADKPALAEKDDPPEACAVFRAHTLRHEMAHAFLYESGLRDYAVDELLVDWLAWQLPALHKAVQEIEALPGPTEEVTAQYIGGATKTERAGD